MAVTKLKNDRYKIKLPLQIRIFRVLRRFGCVLRVSDVCEHRISVLRVSEL